MIPSPTGTIEISEVLSYLRKERYLDKRAAAEYLCGSPRKLEELTWNFRKRLFLSLREIESEQRRP